MGWLWVCWGLVWRFFYLSHFDGGLSCRCVQLAVGLGWKIQYDFFIHMSGASAFLHLAFLFPYGVSSFGNIVQISLQQGDLLYQRDSGSH